MRKGFPAVPLDNPTIHSSLDEFVRNYGLLYWDKVDRVSSVKNVVVVR